VPFLDHPCHIVAEQPPKRKLSTMVYPMRFGLLEHHNQGLDRSSLVASRRPMIAPTRP
jgi:hypothetical protein